MNIGSSWTTVQVWPKCSRESFLMNGGVLINEVSQFSADLHTYSGANPGCPDIQARQATLIFRGSAVF